MKLVSFLVPISINLIVFLYFNACTFFVLKFLTFSFPHFYFHLLQALHLREKIFHRRRFFSVYFSPSVIIQSLFCPPPEILSAASRAIFGWQSAWNRRRLRSFSAPPISQLRAGDVTLRQLASRHMNLWLSSFAAAGFPAVFVTCGESRVPSRGNGDVTSGVKDKGHGYITFAE